MLKHVADKIRAQLDRRCKVCGEGRDYLPHGEAAECHRQMRLKEGRGCGNPSEHHRFEAA